jgi:hypothetical protein
MLAVDGNQDSTWLVTLAGTCIAGAAAVAVAVAVAAGRSSTDYPYWLYSAAAAVVVVVAARAVAAYRKWVVRVIGWAGFSREHWLNT